MSSLSEDIAIAVEQGDPRVGSCRACDTLTELQVSDAEGAQACQAALLSGSLSSEAIADILRRHNLMISAPTLRRHKNAGHEL